MRARCWEALWVLVALGLPAAARGQGATVGAVREPGGSVMGRVCLDLDRDGACGEGEPGIAGARLRFEDGRRALAGPDGRYHAVGITGRFVGPDRSAYGAHAISVDGMGVRTAFELPPSGAAHVDLPVPVPGAEGSAGTIEPLGRAAPRLEREVVLWPLAGTARAGARIRAGEVETRAAEDGRWALELPLQAGRYAGGLSIQSPGGGLALWALELIVARPSAGAPRVYPSPPVLLASMTSRQAGGGIVLVGTVAPGATLRVGGSPLRPTDGSFGAWVAGSGAVEVVASSGGLSVAGRAEADGAARPLDWSVLGEAELQWGGKAGALVSGRIAGSATGRTHGFELEAGFDLDDRDRDGAALASPRDSLAAGLVLDPLRGFVNAGDGGALADSNPGRGRIWARVEGHGQRLQLGSTRSRLGADGLGAHDRTIHGARWEGEATAGSVTLGGLVLGEHAGTDVNGLPPGVPSQDVLGATGGSLFYLSHGSVVAGSEVVRVEWRDPASNLVIERRELVRGRDYELDTAGGRLLLARPLATMRASAAILGGDPFAAAEARLVVDYLRAEAGGGSVRGLAGGEARAQAGPVALSFGGAAESRAGADWESLRGAAVIDLGRLLRARVEVARSEGKLFGEADGRAISLDGGFRYSAPTEGADASALAFHSEIAGEAGPVRWRGWWRERPGGYSDALYDEPVAARERGALGEGTVGPVALKLAWVERRGAGTEDAGAPTTRDSSRGYASAAYALGPVELTVEGLHEQLRLPEVGAQSAAGLRAAWRAGAGLTLECSHLQAFDVEGAAISSTFTAAGASVKTQEGSMAIRAGWGPELGPRLLLSGERGDASTALYGTLSAQPDPAGLLDGSGSAVGGRQRFEGGSLFTEERVARGVSGAVAGRVIGATLEPAAGLHLTLSGERGVRLRADGSTISRGVGGLSAAWVRGALRLDGRGELRREGGGDQWLAGAGAEWSATRSLTLAAHALVSDGEISDRRARFADGWLSAAWRSGPLSVMGRLGRLLDDREDAVERDATTGAMAIALKAARKVTIGLGIDGVRQRLGGTSDDRLSASGRIAWGVVGPLDVALEYARRGSLDGLEIGDLDSLRGEAGLTMGGVRLAVGYTVTGFRGAGLDPEEEDGRFYLRAVLVR